MKNYSISLKLLFVFIFTVLFPHQVMSETNSNSVLTPVFVYKSPSCSCCDKWASHLRKNGFRVEIFNMINMESIKSEFGVTNQYASCHTAVVGEYIIEGHVPADDIKRLLTEKPDINGLTVPGMITGSPGMEGSRQDPYNVLTLSKDGNGTIYSQH